MHVHLGDGQFVGPHAGRSQLKYNLKYILRVRHAQGTSAPALWSKWRERSFKTSVKPPAGTATAWTLRQAGFVLDVVATGTGRATAVGLTAGPDGLYFSELYRDLGATTASAPGARILRIRWVGP